MSDQEKRELAYKLNLQRRQVSNGSKLEIAKQYLLNDWDGQETQQDIAETLGCDHTLISKAKQGVKSELDLAETTLNVQGDNTDEPTEKKSTKPTRLRVDSDKDRENIKEVKEKAEEGD